MLYLLRFIYQSCLILLGEVTMRFGNTFSLTVCFWVTSSQVWGIMLSWGFQPKHLTLQTLNKTLWTLYSEMWTSDTDSVSITEKEKLMQRCASSNNSKSLIWSDSVTDNQCTYLHFLCNRQPVYISTFSLKHYSSNIIFVHIYREISAYKYIFGKLLEHLGL